MRWNHWLRVEVVWPLEAPAWFCLICSMRSRIHAWNMRWGWLAEREFWFNPIYGRVVCGSPRSSWILNMLIRASFLLYLMGNYFGFYVILMAIISLFFLVICWLWVCFMLILTRAFLLLCVSHPFYFIIIIIIILLWHMLCFPSAAIFNRTGGTALDQTSMIWNEGNVPSSMLFPLLSKLGLKA